MGELSQRSLFHLNLQKQVQLDNVFEHRLYYKNESLFFFSSKVIWIAIGRLYYDY